MYGSKKNKIKEFIIVILFKEINTNFLWLSQCLSDQTNVFYHHYFLERCYHLYTQIK
jgi:hypothetical protein